MVSTAVADAVPPFGSVASAVQARMSPRVAEFNPMLEPVPNEMPFKVQLYEIVSDSSSGSLAAAVQVAVSLELGALGLMLTLPTTGSLLMTENAAVPAAIAPSESVAVNSQATVSPTSTMVESSVSDAPVPTVWPVD